MTKSTRFTKFKHLAVMNTDGTINIASREACSCNQGRKMCAHRLAYLLAVKCEQLERELVATHDITVIMNAHVPAVLFSRVRGCDLRESGAVYAKATIERINLMGTHYPHHHSGLLNYRLKGETNER